MHVAAVAYQATHWVAFLLGGLLRGMRGSPVAWLQYDIVFFESTLYSGIDVVQIKRL